jgi:GAF domain-containing protein
LELISLVYALRGKIVLAKVLVPFALILAVTIVSAASNGLKNTSLIALPLIIAIGAILLGRRAIIIFTSISLISIIFIAYLDLSGGIPEFNRGGILATASVINTLITRLYENIYRAQASEEIQKRENAELNELRASLEERVSQRTAQLQLANKINERRARQFQAVAEVTKIISSIQSLESLLPKITNVISEQFNIYHTGIFLLEKNREYAVLRAANSEGGKKMIDVGHKLPVGQTGIVGFVTATGQPRIALDVGADATFFNNPYLPSTRSEMALPLRYSGEVIGALDVQSTESNAFNQDDVDVLFTLADQVAVAINNASTIEEAQKALTEAQSAIRKSTLDAWQVMKPKSLQYGLSLTESSLKLLDKPLEDSYSNEAMSKGKTVIDSKKHLAIPIRLRGQVVGVVNLNTKDQFELTEDNVDIAESIAERLSLALENATLLQAAQNRADFERVTADITSRIGSSTRFETILKTAAQELSRALGGSDVLVQIEPVALELSAGNE